MQTGKIRSYVGFAVKAGKVKIGVDNIVAAKNAPYLVLIDPSLKENSRKKLLRRCENVPTYQLAIDTVATLRGCLALGICEKNLAQAIIKEMEENS